MPKHYQGHQNCYWSVQHVKWCIDVLLTDHRQRQGRHMLQRFQNVKQLAPDLRTKPSPNCSGSMEGKTSSCEKFALGLALRFTMSLNELSANCFWWVGMAMADRTIIFKDDFQVQESWLTKRFWTIGQLGSSKNYVSLIKEQVWTAVGKLQQLCAWDYNLRSPHISSHEMLFHEVHTPPKVQQTTPNIIEWHCKSRS